MGKYGGAVAGGGIVTDIIFETHATTTDNKAGIATGWRPGALSVTGRLQAVELGRRVRGEDIAVVYSSDLARAVETARIAFGGDRGVPLRQDPRLRECDFGDLNGTPMARLAPLRPLYVDRPFPGGQSYRDVVDAMADLLRDLVAEWPGAWVLLIAHSANRWALDCLLGGGRMEELVLDPGPWQPGWHYTAPETAWS